MGIFSKGAQTRVNETIDFIVGGVPPTERATVRSYLNARIQGMTGGGSVKGISDPMSMNDLVNRGTEPERKMRRAIILLESVVMTPSPTAPAVKGLGAGALPGRYNPLLEALRLLADQDRGGANLLRDKFNELTANPVPFLTNNLLLIFGSNQNGLMNQYFVFEYTMGVPKFKFLTARPGTASRCYTVPVLNVPAVLWSNVPGRTDDPDAGSFATINGTHLTGATVMVTTQFSGCSFCFKDHGGQVYAAHIWPDDADVEDSGMPVAHGHGGGTRMARQLAGLEAPGVTGGDFAAPAPGGGNFEVYGTGYSNVGGQAGGYPVRVGNDWMTLIGLRHGGNWTFYSQHVQNGAITRAVQVH
jgi:hypothetical protein